MFMCQSIRQCSASGKHPAVRVLVSPDGHVTSGSNVTNTSVLHSFGSLHDGSYLGIGKDATIEVVWGRPFPFREAKSPWVEWLQCSCSLMCSCSDKHRVLSHDRWLPNRVLAKECHRVMHILHECVHSAELYWGTIDF